MSQMNTATIQQQQFLEKIQQAIDNKSFEKVVLSQYTGSLVNLQKITFRVIFLQDEAYLSALYHYATQDITKNYRLPAVYSVLAELLGECKQANLFLQDQMIQLKKNKKKTMLHINDHSSRPKSIQSQAHDRSKQRYIDQDSVFLQYLGITDLQGQVIPTMAKKWKQINKFIEIFAGALQQIQHSDQALHVVDFGAGKGYLTCALYDYMQKNQQKPFITGVELNPKMVQFCQSVAQRAGFKQLDFFQGDVRTYQPAQLDVMIALHACDIATDFAIHSGIRLNAQIIMCAPCCHKELRPQLRAPQVLQPMLQFGIHAGQQAEMLTDTIRALLLKAHGYETKVFEFVSLEHTSKNKMILAIKRQDMQQPDQQILQQIAALKQMYSIQQHALELLLNDQWQQQDLGCKC